MSLQHSCKIAVYLQAIFAVLCNLLQQLSLSISTTACVLDGFQHLAVGLPSTLNPCSWVDLNPCSWVNLNPCSLGYPKP